MRVENKDKPVWGVGGMAKGSEMRTIDGEEEDTVVNFSEIPDEYKD